MWWKTEARLASVSVEALTPSSSLKPRCESAACDGGDGRAKRDCLFSKQRITEIVLEKRVSGDTMCHQIKTSAENYSSIATPQDANVT